jgi:eukaryotic-like serine/threonine-protein kinase
MDRLQWLVGVPSAPVPIPRTMRIATTMSTLDAATIAQQALRLGLLTEPQYREVAEEAGPGMDPDEFLRDLERRTYLTPWQSQKLLKGDPDGFFLGGYRILYKISSGSFGRVFRADDPRSGRVVAVKILRRRWSEDPQRIELFEREGRVGISLRHPNIVEILAVGKDGSSGQYYIVMEFVEGGNLRELLQTQKKFDVPKALRIIEDASNGLTYAFSRGITHRDIKLTNLLISSSGQAKLVDFGLAKIYSGADPEDGKVERTVDYAGLEKATNVKTGDTRSDIYFLGCVLYEMLTGRSPLETTRNKQQRMQRHRFDNVTSMRPDEIDGPPGVIRLVETMMALDPARRYQTPAQLVEAVRALRREIEGKDSDGEKAPAAPRSVFVVEADERLQAPIRERLKELGYKVFLAVDPMRARDRFRMQPFDALVLDAGTTDEDGILLFDSLLTEAERQGTPLAGVLMLNTEQAEWRERLHKHKRMVVLVRPVTLKQLVRSLQQLVPLDSGDE